MSPQGLVSIVIPAHNRADLIPETLKSASAQSYDNIEILVVDDAGTDDTEGIVSRFSSLDSRIKYFRNERNRGCGGGGSVEDAAMAEGTAGGAG